jgi:hypothetical protein
MKERASMLDNTLRGYKDDLLRPLAGKLGRISPNAITLLAMLVGWQPQALLRCSGTGRR